MLLRQSLKKLRLALVISGVVLLLASSDLPPGDQNQLVRAFTRNIEFDFVGWTLDAVKLKIFEGALGTSAFLSEQDRQSLVYEYLDLVRQIKNLESQIRQIYADPQVDSPQIVSRSLQRDLELLERQRDQSAGLVESILQAQIASVAVEEGLALGGQTVPPVLYHSSPLPLQLVISPREVIRLDQSISLDGNLPLERQIELENSVEKSLNVSALVEDLGGIGTYPTMVVQSEDLVWLSEVVAHEWVHNFLTLRPLGVLYDTNPEMRVINETAASLAGKEIGQRVLERYYPQSVPPAEPQNPVSTAPQAPLDPPPFDFRKEMNITRQQVDKLLAAGDVQEAEKYMDERRAEFWDNGYTGLRRLNQAYFAFHGAYADEPGGAAGVVEDPIGNAVRDLRRQSGSLGNFLQRISWVTNYAALLRLVSGGS